MKTILSSITNLLKKFKITTISIVLIKIFVTIFVIILLIMAHLPLVTLWAGIFATVGVNIAWFFHFRRVKQNKKIFRFWYKSGVYIMVVGLFFHLGCRFYSNMRVNDLQKECQKEKDSVFSSNKTKVNKGFIIPKK